LQSALTLTHTARTQSTIVAPQPNCRPAFDRREQIKRRRLWFKIQRQKGETSHCEPWPMN